MGDGEGGLNREGSEAAVFELVILECTICTEPLAAPVYTFPSRHKLWVATCALSSSTSRVIPSLGFCFSSFTSSARTASIWYILFGGRCKLILMGYLHQTTTMTLFSISGSQPTTSFSFSISGSQFIFVLNFWFTTGTP